MFAGFFADLTMPLNDPVRTIVKRRQNIYLNPDTPLFSLLAKHRRSLTFRLANLKHRNANTHQASEKITPASICHFVDDVAFARGTLVKTTQIEESQYTEVHDFRNNGCHIKMDFYVCTHANTFRVQSSSLARHFVEKSPTKERCVARSVS